MIRLVQLGVNSQTLIEPQALKMESLNNVWIEIVEPTAEELQSVADATELPLPFLRLPKNGGLVELRVEIGFNIIDFLVMQDVASTKKTNPIIIALSKNFLVTVACTETEYIINYAKERLNKTKIDPPSQVAYYIIDEIVATHYEHIEKLEELTSKIEEEVVEKTTPETLKKIFNLKTNMINFNKILWYERGLVFKLHKCGDECMVSKARDLFETTHEDLTRQIDIVETYREILSDAINVHLSATSNKINFSINSLTIVIFYLTIVTTLTSFPNTVATFFGISQFGNTDIFIVAVALFASIILPFIWLWKKKWLSIRTALRQGVK